MQPKKAIYLIGISLFLFSSFVAQAADPVAVVVKTKGRVEISREQPEKTVNVNKGQVLYDKDKIRTRSDSFCAIKFIDDKSLLRIKENSTCIVEGSREQDHINKNVIVEIGSFFASLFKPRGQFTVTTPTSVASVKGTQFWTIQLQDGRTIYIGIEGLIDLLNDAGNVLLRDGQTAIYTSRDRLPEIRLTQDGEIPTFEDGIDNYRSLEIEFRDTNGQTKNLRIDFTEP
jgi:ferric-dicitrate binding protein FerR (iron transport regulator)